MSDQPLTTPEQDDWCDIAQKVRLELQKRIVDIPAMEPEELSHFVTALREAESFEQDAKLHDEWTENRRRILAREFE